MRPPRQKKIALAASLLGLGLLSLAVFASRDRPEDLRLVEPGVREEYGLWRLQRGTEGAASLEQQLEAEAAAEKLADMRSVHAVRPLIELVFAEPRSPFQPDGNIMLGSPSPLSERSSRSHLFWKFPPSPAKALASIGRPAIPGLLEALQEDRLCEAVLLVLGLMGEEAREAVPALEALPDDPVDGGFLVQVVLERIRGGPRGN